MSDLVDMVTDLKRICNESDKLTQQLLDDNKQLQLKVIELKTLLIEAYETTKYSSGFIQRPLLPDYLRRKIVNTLSNA